MRGLLKVGRRATILVAIPTTSGTGSEATLAAVISDSKTHEKYAINDPHLIPSYAILSPRLTVGLPKHITATTGMDALTHAVEAYIGRSNTKYTRQASLKAIKLIDENLLECYHHPDSVQARSNMQIAALEAGVAFTRAYVGHVHCLAHQLGGYYLVPHGLANAVILPIVLNDMFSKIIRPLAQLSDHIELRPSVSSDEEKAKAFIAWIDDMNDKMNITNSFGQLIKEEDIPLLSRRAYREGFPLYPVPELWNQTRYMRIFRKLKQEV
jgi:alcohol dehydrogenase class IV